MNITQDVTSGTKEKSHVGPEVTPDTRNMVVSAVILRRYERTHVGIDSFGLVNGRAFHILVIL